VVDIGGHVESGFEGVRAAFEANFTERGDVGAAVAVYKDGHKVIDLWGGEREKGGRPYDEDTLQLVFSTTKGATAICANLLAQRGQLDFDAPVAEYWPEFAAAGKQDIPVRWLMCHKAGLPYVDEDMTVDEALDWDRVVKVLAEQAPVWEPGTKHGYHAVTYGWLVGEVVRRITGKTLGQVFAEEVAGPLGLEFTIGTPDELHHRIAPLIQGGGVPADPEAAALMQQFMGPDTMLGKALGGVRNGAFFSEQGVFNRPDVWRAELPAANGITNARSLARMYAGVIGGVEDGPSEGLLTPETIAKACEPQTSGNDLVLILESVFGLGFFLSSPMAPYGGPQGFGHTGAGGSVGFADPENGVAFGYVMNKMQLGLTGDERTTSLIRALYEAIGAPTAHVPPPA